MKRREFIGLLGGAAAVRPLAARAKQPGRMRRIGVLLNITADDPESQGRLAAFAQRLQSLGWVIGQNVRVDYRWGGGSVDAMRKHAEELVALAPDVILAQSTSAVAPLLQSTHAVPIVFTIVADPVGAGYVQSLAHPGGNATGFTGFEYAFAGKWLELLKEVAPSVTRAAVLREAGSVTGPAQCRRNSSRCADTGRGVAASRYAQSRRDRAGHHGVRAGAQWRHHRDGEPRGDGLSQGDR